MGNRVKDKVTVITGAAYGIGAGAARLFVEEGARVVLADIQVDAGQALADELGESARFIRADVTKEEDVAAAVGLAVRDFDIDARPGLSVAHLGPAAHEETKEPS